MCFLTAARTYEILKVIKEVIMENCRNEMLERMGNSVNLMCG